jgi:hypothetical protein
MKPAKPLSDTPARILLAANGLYDLGPTFGEPACASPSEATPGARRGGVAL